MKKINKDILSLKTMFNIVVNDFGGLFDPKFAMKMRAIIDEIDATAMMSLKSFKQ